MTKPSASAWPSNADTASNNPLRASTSWLFPLPTTKPYSLDYLAPLRYNPEEVQVHFHNFPHPGGIMSDLKANAYIIVEGVFALILTGLAAYSGQISVLSKETFLEVPLWLIPL